MALATMVAAAASANAGVGGVGTGGSGQGGGCAKADFGKRTLRLGDCGTDVMTLNWILKSMRFERGVRPNENFEDPTEGTLRTFQRRAELGVSGIANARTRRELVKSMSRQTASWYGPGFWGNRTACGQRLKKRTIGVAHKKLPCGTKVVFKKGNRYVHTTVIDRGPYVHGRTWDLTQRAAREIGMTATETVQSAVVR